MQKLITILLVLVGLINFAPVIGLLSAERLSKLYGIAILEGDLLLLMRHRALLLGIVGAFIICAAFRQHLQPVAIILGLVSMLGFVVLVFLSGVYGDEVYRVALVDIGATAALLVVVILRYIVDKQSAQ